MPQKKNPDTLELARAVAGDAAGSLTGVAATLKGLPRAYNRDLQRVDPHVWAAVDAVTEATRVCAGAVATATWDEAAMAADAGDGFSTATGVADALAMAGVPFRRAHEVVANAGEADLDALDDAAREVLGESLFAHVDRAAVERALDPAESVAARDSHGGPAPEAVADALDRTEVALSADRDRVMERRDRAAAAAEELAEVVAGYA